MGSAMTARASSTSCGIMRRAERGILLRVNRSIQVEGVFGVLKQNFGFRRFLTRGEANNETRLFILAIAFNIQTLCNRITNGRFGRSLFEIKAA